jgi:hypothetical protein
MAVVIYTDPGTIPDRVKSIIRVRVGVDLSEYVTSAAMLITGLLQPAGYTQSEMEVLHVWLTAHLYEVDFQRKFRQKIGKSEEMPETKVGLGLDLTRPGQQVKVFDYKNALAPLDDSNKGYRRARVFWAGNPREAF